MAGAAARTFDTTRFEHFTSETRRSSRRGFTRLDRGDVIICERRGAAGQASVVSAIILDGRSVAAEIRNRVAAVVARMGAEHGITPGLAVVLVGDDPASGVYVRAKGRQTVEAGMLSFTHRLPADTDAATLLATVDALNRDAAVHGILVQLPLPAHLDEAALIAAIDPAKDVDGFHVANAGRLAAGQSGLVPCTPLGCLMLIRRRHGSLAGLEAVVIGRSNIVGKPMALLLLGDNATVTICHSRTADLPAVVRRADIVVAAVGRPELVKGAWLKPGATLIDVGINRVQGDDGTSRLVGDADFASCTAVAGAITPVPGGVGPMTIACLLANTLTACCRANDLPVPEDLTA